MADVAQRAGVSYQTVSRVLNGRPNVRAGTRDRVHAAIRELGYRPNTAARTLVTGRSHTLGVITFASALHGPASTLFGIEQAARDADYFLSIVSPRATDRGSVLEAVGRLRAQAVEGVIAIAPHSWAAAVLAQVPVEVTVVGAGHGAAGPAGPVPTVAVDQRAGAVLATRHLLDLGHRTVHHVAGPPGWSDTAGRVAGWRAELKRNGAAVPPPLAGDWSAYSGYAAGRRLARDPAVTAVFCANDHMALGLLRACHEAGRQIPADVSVVGFDDVPGSAYFEPPLSTIRQDFGALGRRALETLVERLHGDAAPPGHVSMRPELVVRASTRPSPAGGRAGGAGAGRGVRPALSAG